MKGKYAYNIASEETYSDGQVVLKEGTPGDWVYVILSGAVEISKSVRGQKYIIEMLEVGEVFGELGFVGGIKRTATARAVGETTLGLIDRSFLEKEYNQLSGQFRSILETITRRFTKILDRIYNFSSRAEPRVPMVLSLTYKHRDAFIQAYTANASSDGLFIKTEKPLKEGKQFLLKLQLPDMSSPMQIKCEVMWARTQEKSQSDRSPGMGIKFCEISNSDRKLLQKLLAAGKNAPNIDQA